jgi:hypothetical protein
MEYKNRLIKVRLSNVEVNILKQVQEQKLNEGSKLNISEYIRSLIKLK